MRKYPVDFEHSLAEKESPHGVVCMTQRGIQQVQSTFFEHYQHLGPKANGHPLFMPDVDVPGQYVIPPDSPLK